MKPQLFGLIGIGLGLLSFVTGATGLNGRNDFAGALLIGGIFIFGCGLIASAIGAKK